MSDKILSQDEISALLGHMGSAKAEPKAADAATKKAAPVKAAKPKGPAESEPAVQSSRAVTSRNVFPILKPQGLGTELENTLNVVLESFAQNGVSTVAAALRAQVNLKLEGMDQLSYREFIQGLPEPSSIWSLKMDPSKLNLALCLESRLVFAIVDLLMGGEGNAPRGKRSITELDQSVVESVIRVFCKEFQEAWSRILKFTLHIEGRETRPGFLQIYSHGESMISIIMLMRAGNTEGQVFWGIPALMLRQFKDRMENQNLGRYRQSEGEARQRIHQIMTVMPTRLEAQINGTRIAVSDLLSMSQGDVIRLEHRVDEPVGLHVNGVRKFTGAVVLSRGRKAVQIV